MTSLAWTSVFAAALVASLAMRAWLAARQVRHVARHRGEVPAPFRASVDLAAHQQGRRLHARQDAPRPLADGRRRGHPARLDAVRRPRPLNAGVRDDASRRAGARSPTRSRCSPLSSSIGAVLELPFEWYSTFRLEQRFGFNRMTWRLWLVDTAKGVALGAAIGVPLLAAGAVDHGRQPAPPGGSGPGRPGWRSSLAAQVRRAELHRAALQPLRAARRTRSLRGARRRR